MSVHYVGKIIESEDGSGTIFDSTREREQEWQFTLDADQTIEGLEVGVRSMEEGEKAILTISPKYAFGEMGNPHGFHGRGKPIPQNATLEFNIELISWEEEDGTDYTTVTNEKKVELAQRLKDEGNQASLLWRSFHHFIKRK